MQARVSIRPARTTVSAKRVMLVHFLTRSCGALFLALAAVTIILSIMDTVPEVSDAAAQLRQGNNPLPIATSVKYRIGSEVLTDVLALALFGLFGWFLWTSEIQQTWAVVITIVLLVGSVVVRTTPVLPINVARVSPGLLFYGALVIDDYYPAPLKPGTRARRVQTFPQNRYNRLAVTEKGLSGSEPHPTKTVVLDFRLAPGAAAQFYAAGGAQFIAKAAGTRTILDWDHEKVVYPVPNLVVLKIAPVGARLSRR